jgi:CheY-like chemotaxis protein
LLTDRPDIHLVFTDIEMPGTMDGIKLATFVRDRWPPVHIIVTSGRDAVDTALLPAGSLFVAKPPSWPILIDAMRRLTRG